MNGFLSESDSDYVTSSVAAINAGGPVLASLGWSELLSFIDEDFESRQAVFALFRAQGRTLASTGALGYLMAQPYLHLLEVAPGTVTAAITRRSWRRGTYSVMAGAPESDHILIDNPETGIRLLGPAEVELRPIEIPGGVELHEVIFNAARTQPLPLGPDGAVARRHSLFLGRVALGLDMLGSAESALATAVDYASDRQQFGQPIGRFQAVRHLLAWARVETAAAEAVADEALRLGFDAPARYDEVVKAVAGRNTRRVCERSLQVLGGIGFTVEHSHHSYHSRVLTLDALLGSSARLASDLAAGCRTGADVESILGTPLSGLPA